MIYSDKIQQAIHFALRVHQFDQYQTRNDQKTPYIIHPLAVALILARIGAPAETIIAGILHDVIEDCTSENPVTKEILEKVFGKDIAEVVSDVSEDKRLSKQERKLQAIEHIAHMRREALLVKSADQLQNMTDLLADFAEKGDEAFAHHESTKAQVVQYYQKRVIALRDAWPENPLIPELQSNLQTALSLWK